MHYICELSITISAHLLVGACARAQGRVADLAELRVHEGQGQDVHVEHLLVHVLAVLAASVPSAEVCTARRQEMHWVLCVLFVPQCSSMHPEA